MKKYSNALKIASFVLFVFILLLSAFPSSVSSAEKIFFADLNWNSAQVHNRIAGFILRHGYGYEVDYVPHQSLSGLKAVIEGTVDINMEVWIELQHEVYAKALVAGKILDLGRNFANAWQGWVVPTYVIKGDASRGIKPVAPDLVSVGDLPRYWAVFQDPEISQKGRYHNCVPGTECAIINERKLLAYGLGRYFRIFADPELGSDYGLVEAYEKGLPWIGYYWTPSWVMGKYDMTPIQEPAFDMALWAENFSCAHPSNNVNIVAHPSLLKRAPEAVAFLKKYETTMDICNQFLAKMTDNMGYADEKKTNVLRAAKWFIANRRSVWEKWLPDEIAKRVGAAIEAGL